MKHIFAVLLASAILLVAPSAWSAPEEKPAAPAKDSPVALDARTTNIAVVLDGTDSIGARLGMKLKEAFNASNLFKLNEGDTPKMRLLVDTKPEFPSRPSVGSVYSVCWVYSQGAGYLNFLLSKEVGTVAMDEIDALVNRLVERTDGLAVKYGNLWKSK